MARRPGRWPVFLLLWLVVPPSWAAAQTQSDIPEFYAALNKAQSARPACAHAGLPLVPDPALEQAASGVARGLTLTAGLRGAGYAFRHAAVLTLSNVPEPELAAAVMDSYCDELARSSAIGLYVSGRKAWLVLALPAAPPPPEAGAVPPPAPAAAPPAEAQALLDLLNAARARARRCGSDGYDAAPPLRWNAALARAAREHSRDMAVHNAFSHVGTDGSHPAERMARAGYDSRFMGENIAAGQTTPQEAVSSWLESPDHCANIMNPEFRDTGGASAAESRSELGVYWTQMFAAPDGASAP